MATLKKIAFLLVLFLIGSALIGFLAYTGAWNNIQLLFIAGAFFGVLIVLLLWIWTDNKPGSCDEPDLYIKNRECDNNKPLNK